MKKFLLIISICFVFVETTWSQNERYIEIRRPYRVTPDESKPAEFIQFFVGEVYLGAKKTVNGREIIYGNLELHLPFVTGNTIYNLINDKSVEDAIKQKQQRIKARLDSTSVILRKFISGKEVYQFDVSAIKTSGGTILFASNKQIGLRFQNKNIETVSNLDAIFPDEYIRMIIPGIPTRFTEKAAIKSLEPIYDFDREKYVELIGSDNQRFLQNINTHKIFRTNANYTSSQEESDKTIKLKNGNLLKIESNGKGFVISTESSSSFLNDLLFYVVTIVVGVVIGLFVYGQYKREGSWLRKILYSRKSRSRHKSFSSRDGDTHFQPEVPVQSVSENVPAEFVSFANAVDNNFSSLRENLSEVSGKLSHFESLLISQQNNPEILQENNRLKEDMAELRQTLNEKNTELEKMRQDHSREATNYHNLSRYVDQLSGSEKLVQSHLEIFSFLLDIEKKVENLLSRSNAAYTSGGEAFPFTLIFSKYTITKNQTELYRWQSILQGMRDNGVITDREALQRIKGESDQEKLKTLNAGLHKQVYRDFVSAIMILLEDVRNLEYFTKSPQRHIIDEARNFDRDMQVLRTKLSQLLGIEIQYVPLFDNYKKYANINIKAVDEPHHLLYKILKLERNSIQEIISYGLKSPYLDEPTKVILAK